MRIMLTLFRILFACLDETKKKKTTAMYLHTDPRQRELSAHLRWRYSTIMMVRMVAKLHFLLLKDFQQPAGRLRSAVNSFLMEVLVQ